MQTLILRKHSLDAKIALVKKNGAIYGHTVSSVPKHRRRRLVMSFEMVRLNRASSEPLYQQLYRQIREELESGSFDSSASRVPSSRVLAATLGISRPTVNEAFSKLLEKGYLQARKRSGIFVADHLPATFLKARSEEHTSELQSRGHLVCRLLLEKKNRSIKDVIVICTILPSTSGYLLFVYVASSVC